MNNKQAKAMRKIAQSLTIGMPERQLVRYNDGSAVNSPESTRGVYRAIKSGREIDRKRIVKVPARPRKADKIDLSSVTFTTPSKPAPEKKSRISALFAALAGFVHLK